MKKYKVSGKRENGNRWEYIGRRTIEQVEKFKTELVYAEYRLIDIDTNEEIIIKR